MSSHEKLSAASNDRKARLAQLKSLKRKQAPEDTQSDESTTTTTTTTTDSPPSVTTTYLSGRNFDPSTRNVRLGFDHAPTLTATSTLEHQAAQLALQTQAAQEQDDADAPLDLFKLQPKKANWDLKRDLQDRMREAGLERGLERAVVRLVRERVGGKKGEEGLQGGELVEGMRVREVEEERERRRDEEEEG